MLILYLACLIQVVTPWTVDLPEVRQYFFNKHSEKHPELVETFTEYPDKKNVSDDRRLYSNFYGNSKLTEDNVHHGMKEVVDYEQFELEPTEGVIDQGFDGEKYANDYEYQSYMEKKVKSIVHNGSKYLEGLRRSLEKFYETIEACSRVNFNETSNQKSTSLLPERNTTYYEKCANATRKSEEIRRIAQLALHTTRMLQDRVYSSKYDEEEYDIEDRTLILRLAWFLDKLALLTGYDPEVKEAEPEEYNSQTPSSPQLPPSPFPTITVPDDIKLAMMNCLKNKSESNEPATVRCNFPVNYPDFMNQLFNITPSETQSRSKRSAEDSENPLLNVLQYYAKYKAWTNANPESGKEEKENVESNKLKQNIRIKRTGKNRKSFPNKLAGYSKFEKTKFPTKRSSYYPYMKKTRPNIPEDPMQDISYYIKNKRGTNYNPDLVQAAQVRLGLEQIFQNGNIEVIRRYGSNYNPLVPSQLYVGLLRSFSDLA